AIGNDRGRDPHHARRESLRCDWRARRRRRVDRAALSPPARDLDLARRGLDGVRRRAFAFYILEARARARCGGERGRGRSAGILRRWWAFAPLLLFAALAVALALGLRRDPAILPSALIGKPLPEFVLTPVRAGEPGFSSADIKGQVVLINVYGS